MPLIASCGSSRRPSRFEPSPKDRLHECVVQIETCHLEPGEEIRHINQSLLGAGTEDTKRSRHAQIPASRLRPSCGLVDQQEIRMERSCERDGCAFAEIQVVCDRLNLRVWASTPWPINCEIQSRTMDGADGEESSLATASGTTTWP